MKVPIFGKITNVFFLLRGTYQLVVKKSSWESLKRKLKRLTKKTLGYNLSYRLTQLKLVWQGWLNNYRIANIHTKLKQLDEWLRNRLRYCTRLPDGQVWHDWKKPERKRKNFIRLGIAQGQAYAWSRTRMGGWVTDGCRLLSDKCLGDV